MRGLGLDEPHLEATAVDLGPDYALPRRPGGVVARRPHASGGEAFGLRGQLLALDQPVAGLPGDETGMCQERPVERDERGNALDRELVERAEHAAARALTAVVEDDQLGDQRVVQPDHLRALGDS